MEENNNEEKVETLEENTTSPVVEETQAKDKKNNKNSAILIFSVLGAVIFMVAIAVALNFLPKVFGGSTTTTKTGNDAKKVYSTYAMSGNGLDKFDLAFLKLENGNKNMVYSPLSIKYALSMLSEASDGATKNQIDAVIGEYKSKKYPNNEHMSFANAMFIRNSYKDNINREYTTTLLNKYNAEVKLDEFANATNMNKWVSEKTFNLINNLFEDSKVKEEDFILTNALAIDMNWNNQLQCASGSKVPCISYSVTYKHETEAGKDYFGDYVSQIFMDRDYPAMTFNGKENIKSVLVKAAFNNYDAVKEIGEDKIREEVGKAYKEWLTTEEAKLVSEEYFPKDVNKYLDKYIKELNENYGRENQSTDFKIYTDDDIKVFAKDLKEYDGVTLQYVGIMPKNVSLDKYVEKVEAQDISKIIDKLKDMKKENFKEGVVTLVSGNIPLFDYEYKLSFMEDLENIGIKNIFDINKADLSKMLGKNSKACITDASHKAKIEFSNDGIKAAAVTAMGGAGATGAGFDYLYDIPIERIDITFDKPYMYIIRDKATGEVWFTGTVYEPIVK